MSETAICGKKTARFFSHGVGAAGEMRGGNGGESVKKSRKRVRGSHEAEKHRGIGKMHKRPPREKKTLIFRAKPDK